LRRRDQLDQIWRGALAQVRARRVRGIDVQVDLPERPPDSRFARTALEACRDLSSEALAGHCLRTWLWADALAQVERLGHDCELLFAAAALHDLGLTPKHWCSGSDCFAVDGARAAETLARESDYPRAAALAEAISLHLNVAVPVKLGAEAHLLAAGAACDVVGAHAHEIPRPARSEVLRRHPRDGFAAEMTELVRRQASERPRSRAGLLWRIGFPGLIAQGDRVFERHS
jgi:hypothetical protein